MLILERVKNDFGTIENKRGGKMKRVPKKDGSGKGTGANAGRGCANPKKPNQKKATKKK